MKHHSACGLALTVVLLLTACGSDSERALTVDEIREFAGLSAPTETPDAQQARSLDILQRADSLVLSTMHGETGDADLPTFRLLTQCSGMQCTTTEPLTGSVDTIDLANTPLRQGAATAIGSKHGITLLRESSTHTGADVSSFGAWLEHSSFAILNESQTGEEGAIDVWYAISLGELTGTPLSGSATWLGVMVGTPVTGDARGEQLVGDAILTYDFHPAGDGTVPSLDVGFGGIKNIDRGTAHDVEAVIFVDLAVEADGTFARGESGARIQGGFHGPGHAEAAGIFEYSDMTGAFGATRQ